MPLAKQSDEILVGVVSSPEPVPELAGRDTWEFRNLDRLDGSDCHERPEPFGGLNEVCAAGDHRQKYCRDVDADGSVPMRAGLDQVVQGMRRNSQRRSTALQHHRFCRT